MSTYYRKVENCEGWQHGDVMYSSPGDGIRLRPVTITEVPPGPPAHRVEDETWHTYAPTGDGQVHVLNEDGAAIIWPPRFKDFSSRFWPQRAKRIVAGQEALKALEARKRIWGTLELESERILASLKD